MSAGPPIESLTAVVTLDVTQFTSRVAVVQQTLDDLYTRFQSFGSKIAQVTAGLGASISGPIAAAATQVGASLTATELMVTAFASKLNNVNWTGLDSVGRAFGRIGDLLNSLNASKIGAKGLESRGSALAGFVTSFSTSLDSLNKVQLGNFRTAGYSMGHIGEFLEGVRKIDITGGIQSLPALATNLQKFLGDMGSVDPTKGLAVANVLSKYRTSIAGLTKIDPKELAASGNAVVAMLKQLSAIPVTANLTSVANVVQRIGLGMRNMARGGVGGPPTINVSGTTGGGGTGSGLSGMAGGFRNVSNAAGGATSSLGNFGQAAKALFLTSDTAMKGLQRIQTSLLGIGVLGVAQFARMDDALTRTMAHMRAFDSNDPRKDQLQRGMFEISSISRTGAGELAKGLDVLVSSGMNATMALENLATAENFAVASGMPMHKATQRLTDLMNGLGLAVEDTVKHKSNMTELADMIVGIASKSGSTEEQLSEAFSGRFINSMKTAKMEVKDALSLLATYSRFGESTRGAAAGTRLSRGLENMMMNVSAHGPMWNRLLGGDTVSEQGKLLIPGIELLERLSKAIDTVDRTRGNAQMMKLGFDTEGMAALNPLLRHFPTIKLIREEIEQTGGVSEKTAALIRSSLLGQLTTLFNVISTIATIFGERLAPAIHGVTIAISNLSLAFARLAPWYQNLIIYGSMAFVVMRNFGMVTSLLLFTLSPLAMALNGLVGGITLMYNGFMLLVKLPSMLISGFQSLFGYLTSAVRLAFMPLTMTLSFIGETWRQLYNIGMVTLRTWVNIGSSFASLVANLLTGLIGLATTLVTVIASFVLLGPMIGLLGTVFAAGLAFSAAAAMTLITALGSLASVIGAGLVAAWAAFQAAATAALAWVGRAVTNLHDNIGSMWATLQNGVGPFIQSIKLAFATIAGFFWNFRQNMTTIWTWFGKYGEQVFIDIANAGFKFMSILGGNLMKVFNAVGATLYDTLSSAWKAFMDYAGSFGDWLALQWPNIVGDLGRIMGVMFSSFKDNFVQLFDLIGKMVGTITEQIQLSIRNAAVGYTSAQTERVRNLAKSELKDRYDSSATMTFAQYKDTLNLLNSPTFSASPENYEKSDSLYFQGKRADAMKGWGNFKSADTDLSKIGFKTNFSGMFPKAEGSGFGQFDGLGDSIKSTFSKAFAGMQPLALAFSDMAKSPIWHELLGKINTNLPEGGLGEAAAKFTKMFFPTAATEGDMGMAPPARGGPGFKFDQISMERTMIGGDVAESLEHQKLNTLKSIDRKQDNIVNAINGLRQPAPPPPGPPVIRKGP